MKKLLLTFLILATSLVFMQAEVVTVDFTKMGFSNAQEITEIKVDEITLTFDAGGNSNSPKYYTSGTAIRCYTSNSVTVKANSGYKVTDIQFTTSDSYKFNGTILADDGEAVTYNVNTWKGEAETVKFTQTASSQFRTSSVSITYINESSDTREEVRLSFPQTMFTVPVGGSFEAPELICDPVEALSEVVYKSSNENIAEVASDGSVKPKGSGVVTITASIPDNSINYKYAFAQYTLSVVDFSNPVTDLTPSAFNISGNSYQLKTFTDSKYGVEYKAVAAFNNGFSFNTNSNGKGSGIYVTQINNEVKIKDITITFSSANTKEIAVYSSSSAIPGPNEIKTGYEIPEGATLIKQFSTTTTVEIDDYAFAILPVSGNAIVSKVSVTYEYQGAEGGQRFEFDPFNESYVLNQGESFKFELPEDAPIITYTSSFTDFAEVINNEIVAKKGGNTIITATWDAVPGKWYAGHETMAVSVAFEDLATMITECNDGEKYTGNFEVTVGLDHNSYNYVTDGTDWTLFYVNHNHGDGAVIPAGWSGTFTHYAGLPEFTNLVHAEPSEAKGYKVDQFSSLDINESLVNEVLVLYDVIFAESTPYSSNNAGSIFTGVFDGKEYQFLNQFRVESVSAGSYNVKCAISYDEEDGILIFPVEYRPLGEATTAATHKVKTYGVGDVIEFEGLEEGAHVLYRHGGEDPDHTNVFTGELNPANAPRKAPDVNTDLTYNHTTHPLTFQPGMMVKYMTKAPGKLPSAINYIALNDNGTITGVDNIVVDNEGEAVYYNLQGVRVDGASKLPAGLYIRVADGKASKVLVK